MLNQLLALLEIGGTWRVIDLAAALGTSPELVNAMLDYLTRSGKLELPEQSCAGACTTCALASTCKAGANNPLFIYASPKSKSAEAPETNHSQVGLEIKYE
jgi:hypothetical protein